VQWDHSGALVWLERRAGRGILVAQPPDGSAWRELWSEVSTRGRLSYGGGEFGVGHGWVYFVEAQSGQIQRGRLAGGPPEALTPPFGGCAAPTPSPDGRWLLYLHTVNDQDALALLPSDGSAWPVRLAAGSDFYMQPAWHPDGQQIAWIEWDFPNMPWDETRLCVGRLAFPAEGAPYLAERQVLVNVAHAAISQPTFSPDGGSLAYLSDESGWGQLYLHDLASGTTRQLTHGEREHALPAWVQGLRRFGFTPDGRWLYYLENDQGYSRLLRLSLPDGAPEPVALPEEYAVLDQIALPPHSAQPDAGTLALIASGPRTPPRLLRLGASATPSWSILRRVQSEEFPPETLAAPETVHWASHDGAVVHGLLYLPQGEAGGKPPLLVNVHGGPTGQALPSFNLEAQFFVGRGYAYLDVNYRGSPGFGRAYQDALLGEWGVVDVADVVSGAQAMADSGRVDGARLAIMGGSAGGYTLLQALVLYPDLFRAAVCRYGIAEQVSAALVTHKFERRYNDLLIGPLPEATARYRERSPLYRVAELRTPLALFQGEDDEVVERAQSDLLAEALRRRGVDLIYRLYPGEGHGFRQPETIRDYFATVAEFLQRQLVYG
jgi:dipeptidyl aminopeptidase/acylaminoacyl peptidase